MPAVSSRRLLAPGELFMPRSKAGSREGLSARVEPLAGQGGDTPLQGIVAEQVTIA